MWTPDKQPRKLKAYAGTRSGDEDGQALTLLFTPPEQPQHGLQPVSHATQERHESAQCPAVQ
jgi:hypothetical protein